MTSKILYITWDGPEQNYLESLFFPLLSRARTQDMEVHVLQFTWGDSKLTDSIARAAKLLDLHYTRVTVARQPLSLATAAMIGIGAQKIREYVDQHRIEVIVARSLIPAAMVLSAPQLRTKTRFVFDTDGLMADERVEFGGWSNSGFHYRVFREIERQACQRADCVLTRTRAAKNILLARVGADASPEKFVVIPNGKDSDLFKPPQWDRDARGGAGPSVIYVGSLGPQYLPGSMFTFFSSVLAIDKSAHFTVLTGQVEMAQNLASEFSIPAESISTKRVSADDVPRFLGEANLGLALRMPSFSQSGVAPIKVAEYLLCGLPVLANRGVGDLDEQLADDYGILLSEPEQEEWGPIAKRFLEVIIPQRSQYQARAREAGLTYFDLDRAASLLRNVLDERLS